jgi:5-bromo-4-chloroindolyl phosphate hydrolysis protein
MNQTRLGSLIEALFNVAIGFAINMVANVIILPLVGFHMTLAQNLFIGVLYTVVSVARSYCVRRWFNQRLHAAALRLAERAAP